MASVDVIFVAIVILGIIYMYINSRQYLVREGFGSTAQGPNVSWPGGVVSPPPYSVTAPSGSGYRW